MIKTMPIKLLENKKITYQYYEYDSNIDDALEVANSINKDPGQVFKTLVTKSTSKIYVFMIPSNKTLDLKKCAKSLNEKSIEMIKQKELEPLTGYIHGGCSPLCMKKLFPTFIDSSILNYDTIIYSGGLRGVQIETKIDALKTLVNAKFISIVKE